MKRAGWAWFRTESRARFAVRVIQRVGILLLIGYALSPLAMVGLHHADGEVERITQVSRWEETLPGTRLTTESLQRVLSGAPPPADAIWEPARLPITRGHAPVVLGPHDADLRRVWFRFRYELPPANDRDRIALHSARWIEGAWQVWIDGQPVADNLSHWRMQWNRPLYVELPEMQAARSYVDVMIALPYRPQLGYTASSILAGPRSAIAPVRAWRDFLQATMPQISTAMITLMGLLSLHFWLHRRTETLHLLLALSAVAWWVTNLQFQVEIPDDPALAAWFTAISDSGSAWVMLLVFTFAFRLEGRRCPRIERMLFGYAAVVTVVSTPLTRNVVDLIVLQHALDVLVSVSVATFLTVRAVVARRRDLHVMCIAVWSCIAFGAHDVALVAQWIDPEHIYWLPYGTLFLFAAFVFAVQRRYVQALSEVEQANQTLERRLAERQAELERQHRRLRQVEHEQLLMRERQRLMQEMHDGVGSSLISSLAMLRQGTADAASVAEILQECIDDLRLIVDSMEPFEHDVATLIGNLRYRLGRRLEAAGLQVEWRIGKIPGVPWLDPPAALQILRIVQEAITNVLKHARAKRLRIGISVVDGFMRLAVVDNGCGFELPRVDPAHAAVSKQGRGLSNMRARAAAIGAEISWQREAGETRVILQLPLLAEGRSSRFSVSSPMSR